VDTASREFREETGLQIRVLGNLGTKDFVVPYRRKGFAHTHCHHIAILYEVAAVSGDIRESPNLYDSDGAEWVAPGRLQVDSCSPLVTEALYWLANRRLSEGTTFYDEWETYERND
jgi:ADP-ribose pyrophosphatase YjhB (NUDIX family)